ncbi:MAG: MBL fold metallo-hydrolase [Trueperaceae bacterium]|nr:MBL fold metallo-hydrolase [Trueperaceae bacterium]
MKQLTESVWQIDLGNANVYLLKGKQGLILIDTATHGSLRRLERKLKQQSIVLQDIKHILITHAHVDHVGGLKEIQAATQAEVWAHKFEASIIRGETAVELPSPDSLSQQDKLIGKMIGLMVGKRQDTAPVHHELEAGQSLHELFDGLELLHLPGHSWGHSGFYLAKQKLLIGGDVMMHLMPWLTRPLAAYTADMAQADKSIRLVNSLGLDALAVGHGAAIMKDAATAITRLSQKITKRKPSAYTAKARHK